MWRAAHGTRALPVWRYRTPRFVSSIPRPNASSCADPNRAHERARERERESDQTGLLAEGRRWSVGTRRCCDAEDWTDGVTEHGRVRNTQAKQACMQARMGRFDLGYEGLTAVLSRPCRNTRCASSLRPHSARHGRSTSQPHRARTCRQTFQGGRWHTRLEDMIREMRR